MPNQRFALLVRTKDCLELKVFNNQDGMELVVKADQSQDFRQAVKIQEQEGVIGDISFIDSRAILEILTDFSNVYLGGSEIQASSRPCSLFVKYPIRFEPTIAPAFVQYFSSRR